MTVEKSPKPATRKRVSDGHTTLYAAYIGAAASIIAALVGFLVPFLFPQQPNQPTIVTDDVSFSQAIGVNLDTNPITLGPPSNLPLALAVGKNSVTLTTSLPLSLAQSSDTSTNPPSLNECQQVISAAPVLKITTQKHEWVCVRTEKGSTQAIWIKNIVSPDSAAVVFYHSLS